MAGLQYSGSHYEGDGDEVRIPSSPGATHLDTPLRDHEPLLILGRKKLDSRIRGFIKKRTDKSIMALETILMHINFPISNKDSIEIGFSRIQKDFFRSKVKIKGDPYFDKFFINSLKIAQNNTNSQARSLGLQELETSLTTNETKNLQGWFNIRMILQEAIMLTGSPLNTNLLPVRAWDLLSSNIWTSGWSGFKLFVTPNMLVICTSGGIFLGSRDHLLSLHDLAVQRGTLVHSCFLAEKDEAPTSPSSDLVKEVLDWGDQILEDIGNDGFNLVSQWESLCIGVLATSVPDPVWDNHTFLNTMKREFLKTYDSIDSSQYLASALSILFRAVRSNPNQLTQLYGLYRIWGHPTVNAAKGIEKLKSYACKEKPINYSYVARVTNLFKEKFCLDYRATHNTWPKLKIETLDKTSYLREVLENNQSLYIKDPRYRRSDWEQVESDKTFEILPKYNLIKLISDKAMSLNLDELADSIQRGSIGPAWSRSVLYKWLTSEIGDPQEFLMDIAVNGFGPYETIVGVCPKERELKLYARLFGLLTLRKRMYVVLTEAMLAEHIIPYFPEITMLDDHITLMKKMYSTTSGKQEERGSVPIYTSLDFEKWNSNMREEETKGFFKWFDGLFGMADVYTRTHEMFKDAQLYLADGTYLPRLGSDGRLIEDEYCWSGHLGGIEGLRQKGWTIFTVSILRLVMSSHGYSYSLMGQGDNQVLKINYPRRMTDDQIKDAHKSILADLDEILRQIGPPLKLSESWSSSKMFLYGKFPILSGVPLSMSLKREVRFMSLDNENFPTLDSSLSSLMANVQSACNFSTDIRIPFYLYSKESSLSIMTYHRFNYLGRYPLPPKNKSDIQYGLPREGRKVTVRFEGSDREFREVKSMTPNLIEKMLIFPKILGGYSMCLFGNLLTNGFPDPLSENIALLKKLYLSSYHQEDITKILSPKFKSWIEADLLCEDPVSVNLCHPSSPKESLKRLVQDFLSNSSWIENKNFKEFISISFLRQKELCNALLTIRPCNPRIMHSITEATLVGRAIQVVGQLDKTNTITSMMIAKSKTDAGDKIAKHEREYFYSVMCNLANKGDEWDSTMCSRQWAQDMREKSWGLPISGVTVAPIVECFSAYHIDEKMCEEHPAPEKGYFLQIPEQGVPSSVFKEAKTIGRFTPFLGSKTEVKTHSGGRDLARKSQPLIKSAAELLTFIRWGTEVDSELSLLITKIFNSLTDLTAELFIPLAGEVSGTIDHRWGDTATKHGANLSILYSPATYMHLSSNKLIGYQAKGENFNLHFQALMGFTVCWATQVYKQRTPETIHWHVSCDRCIIPINEEKYEIAEHSWDTIIKSLPGNPICWVSSQDIPLVNRVGAAMEKVHTIAPGDSRGLEIAHELIGQHCVNMTKYKTIESGDGRQTIAIMGGLNISWNGKISYRQVMEKYTFKLLCLLLYRSEMSVVRRLNSFSEICIHYSKIIATMPPNYFLWSSSFYLNERLMDEMTGCPWSDRFPPDVPLNATAAGQHTRTHVLNILNMWALNKGDEEFHYTGIAQTSKNADSHPLFSSILMRMRVSDDVEFFRWRTLFFLFRSLIGNFSLDLGNNIKISWMLVQSHHRLDDKIRSSLNLDDIRGMLLSNPIIFVNNHIDNICAGLKPQVDPASYLRSNPLSFEDNGLNTDNFIITLSSESFHLDKEQMKIDPPDMTNVPFDDDIIKNRRANLPTSSSYKLLEILYSLRLLLIGIVAAIADGAGGFSYTLSRIPEVKTVFYNSFFDSSELMDQAAPNFVPPAFVGHPEQRKKLIGLDQMISGHSDVTTPQFWRQLGALQSQFPLNFLICDAEAGDAEDRYKGLRLLETVISQSYQLNIPIVVVKSYLNPIEALGILLSLGASYYKKIQVVRCVWSGQYNTEVYMVLQGCLEVPRHHEFLPGGVYQGPSLHKKILREMIQSLRLYNARKKIITRSMSDKYNELLTSPLVLTRERNLLMYFLGNWGKQDTFPFSFIKEWRKSVTPIRFNQLKRRAGGINLIKHQLAKRWALGWLMGLYRGCHLTSRDLELWFMSGFIHIYATGKGWAFWVLKSVQSGGLPSTKTFKLTDLIDRSELKNIIRLSSSIDIQCDIDREKGLIIDWASKEHKYKDLIPIDKKIQITI